MKQIKIQTQFGGHISKIISEAKELADKNDAEVSFDFNGVTVVIASYTNTDNLMRDYDNAFLMEWGEIGPRPVAEYSQELKEKIQSARRAQDKRNEEQRAQYEAERQAKESAIRAKVSGVRMEFSDEALWEKGRANNTDPYGNAVYEYAELWAKLMQAELSNGNPITIVSEPTSFEADVFGITGYQQSAAKSIIRHCWLYGDNIL